MEHSAEGFIDTVALTQTFQNLPPAEQFLSPNWSKIQKVRNGKLAVFTLNSSKNSKMPRLTLSQTANYLWHLTAEVSFPGWLRGTNFPLCNEKEIPLVLSKLSDFVSEHINFEFNAFTARVLRSDFAQDMMVGQANKPKIIKGLSEMPFDNFKRHLIDYETIYFENKGVKKNYVITFYDKYAQFINSKSNFSDSDLLNDILRIEVRMRTEKIKGLIKSLSLPDNTATSILRKDVADFVLERAKDQTNLKNCLVNNTGILSLISEENRLVKLIPILGFRELVQRLGANFHNLGLNFTKKTYQRYVKKSFEIGINPFE